MVFKMWSLLHILFMLSPFITFILLHLFTKKLNYRKKRVIGIGLSVIAVLLLILRNIEILVGNGWKLDAEVIPLQICHFANFVLLFAFIFDSKSLFGLSYCLNLPAAFLSIVFANSLENYTTLWSFGGMAFLLGHMLIVCISLWSLFNGFVLLNKKIFQKILGLMFGLFFGSILINNFLNIVFDLHANYFYSLQPEEGTPLEWFYNWGTVVHIGQFEFNPLYLILTAVFGVIVVMLFYFIYMVKKDYFRKNSLAKESAIGRI